jgi:Transposase and inactivated derivatives
MTEQNPFRWRHFQADIILLCVRWYLRYTLSYRDLEEIMLERGLHVDHTTIYRWVQQYAPELKKTRPSLFEAHNRFLACGRNLHQDQKGVDAPVSGGGFRGKDARLLVEFNQRWRSRQALLFENACRLSYELATRDQRR